MRKLTLNISKDEKIVECLFLQFREKTSFQTFFKSPKFLTETGEKKTNCKFVGNNKILHEKYKNKKWWKERHIAESFCRPLIYDLQRMFQMTALSTGTTSGPGSEVYAQNHPFNVSVEEHDTKVFPKPDCEKARVSKESNKTVDWKLLLQRNDFFFGRILML